MNSDYRLLVFSMSALLLLTGCTTSTLPTGEQSDWTHPEIRRPPQIHERTFEVLNRKLGVTRGQVRGLAITIIPDHAQISLINSDLNLSIQDDGWFIQVAGFKLHRDAPNWPFDDWSPPGIPLSMLKMQVAIVSFARRYPHMAIVASSGTLPPPQLSAEIERTPHIHAWAFESLSQGLGITREQIEKAGISVVPDDAVVPMMGAIVLRKRTNGWLLYTSGIQIRDDAGPWPLGD